MEDVYEKDLAQKTSLSTGDFIRMVGSDNVSYKQPVNSVKDLFNTNMPIKQMTSSSFADLDTQLESISGLIRYISATAGTDGPTTSKNTWTILGYRNSTGLYAFQFAFTFDYTIYVRTKFNSQTWSAWESIPRTKNIASGDDLNNYHATGFYVITTGSNNVDNCPSGYSGMLVLGAGTSTTASAHQLVYNNSGIWKRSYTGSPIAWTAWEKMPTRAEMDAVKSQIGNTKMRDLPIASGASGEFAVVNTERGTMFVSGTASGGKGIYAYAVTSSGVVGGAWLVEATNVAVDASTANKILITNNSAAYITARVLSS